MHRTLIKHKVLKNSSKQKTISPYFLKFQCSIKPKKLNEVQGDNKLKQEGYKYTVKNRERKLTKLFATPQEYFQKYSRYTLYFLGHFWGFKIQYLRPWTEEAKMRTGQNKVDIVAHSMGGLVTRSYIQSNKYQNDIRNFVMVGTPNQGSANPYFIWEGGDPITLDILTHGFSGWSKYFYTNTIYENYQEVTGSDDLCIWVQGRAGLKYDTPVACNKEKVYDFVHKNAPSLGQLMPAYSGALVDTKNNTTKDIEIEKNEFLLALNSGGTYMGETYTLPSAIKQRTSGKDKIFYSNNNDTIKNISIDTSKTNNSNYLYKDGIVDINPYSNLPNVVYENGDGTVPQSSAQFVFNDFFGTSNVQHATLIKSLIPQIINVINLSLP